MTTLAALLVPAPEPGPTGLDTLAAAVLGVADEDVTVRVDRVQPRDGHLSVGLDISYPGQDGSVRDYLVASDAPVALAAARSGRAALVEPAPAAGNHLASDNDDASADDAAGPAARQIAVWRHPDDPELPGLAAACTLSRVRELLPQAAGLTILTYRPLRRAVVRVDGPDGSALGYLKVVRPHRFAELRERHLLVSGAPSLLGPAAELAPGVLALDVVVGTTLTDALVTGLPVPPLAQLRPRVAPGVPEIPAAATPWADSLESQVRAPASLLAPETLAWLRGLADAATHAWQRCRETVSEAALVHGDLHPGNVVLADGGVDADDGDVVRHLDVDRAGTGFAVDDDACLLAHTELLAREHPEAARACAAWWSEVASAGPETLAATRARTAAVLLTLVPVLAHRAGDVLELAEGLLGPIQKEEER